ncbi:FAD-dependent monooxygenase [Caulobacter soli]|uniref:FAD-dependent monooxygenase n=1 Tax=Caulobacter soli TaxID=2708539 RepID=UPI0013EC9243|nr:FAD-dependent monooxygenase [Caulobacter soli]
MSLNESKLASDTNAFEVVVIGAGPVGLLSAIQLGRAGVKTLLLERRSSFSVHPKASGIHARTMEIYRQLGLADLIRKNSVDWDGVFTIGWMTRMAGIELGQVSIGATQEEQDLFRSWSPELMAFCSQDIYEPLFAEALKQYPSVELRLASEVRTVEQDDDGVRIGYASPKGAEMETRAQYVIGADGVRSPTRTRLGISESGHPSMGNAINVVFEADLEPYRAGRQYGLFWVVNGDTQGAFGWRRRGNLWSYNFEAAEGEDPLNYTPERCAEIIRQAAGVPDLALAVTSILHWKHDQAVTDRWRAGRIFLAGDAAHRFPPHGGFGMNSGVQDSHNLVWKLVARLRWGAGDGLLDSYQDERKPVAQSNGEQMILNTKRMAETGFLSKNPQALSILETPEGEPMREKMREAIPKQREQILSQGQQFGQIYTTGAIVGDGAPAVESTVSTYRPTGNPGARAPHVWLTDGQGRSLSTIDLYNGGFVLFAGRDGAAWTAAAAQVLEAAKTPLVAHQIGGAAYAQPPADTPWEDLVGVGPTGALLIRPDGHVGARWTALPTDPAAELKRALSQILDLAAVG